VSRIVQNLQSWQPAVVVKLSHLLVLTITRSLQVSSRTLLAAFEECDGYSVLASTAVWLDKVADTREKIRFVQVLRSMLFIGTGRAQMQRAVASNPKAFRVLLWVMSEIRSEALTGACWKLVEKIIQSSYPQLQEIEPFRLMLEHFDSLSIEHRLLVLRSLRHAMKSSNLLLAELRAIVGVVQSTCPSSVLLVCDFFRSLLAEKIVHPRTLLPSRILHVLLQMLVPGEQLPCANVLLMSATELQLCLSIRSEQDIERQRTVGEPVSLVLECILRRVLALIWEMIARDIEAFREFQTEGGTKRLVGLASSCVSLRPDVFVVLVGVVSCDPSSLRSELIPKLAEMLRDAGGTASIDVSSLTLRTQVLDTLTSIFNVDSDSRVLFREQGGFTWILAVLAGIGSAIKEQPEQELDRPFLFVVRLPEMLASCLTDCPSNQDHLRNVVGISTLSDVLLSTGFFGNNRFLYQLVQSLLKVAVETKWPCEEGDVLIMRNPEIVYVVVVLMVHHQNVIDSSVLLKVFAELNLLVERSLERHLLCSKRLLGILLSHYVSRLGELEEGVQNELLHLVRRLSSYHVSHGEVKQLLQILPTQSPRVFSSLCLSLSVNQTRPKESLCFPWNASSFLDFGPFACAEWPFSSGFSISFWIQIAGRRLGGDASVHVVSFSPSSSAHPFFVAVTVTDEGRVCLWSSTTEFFVFSSCDALSYNEWNHVVVSHAPANNLQKKKRQIGLCKLHVNGMLRGVGSLSYGPMFGGSDLQITVRLGDQSPGSSLWFLGNLVVFRDVQSDESAAVLNDLGSSAMSFSETNLQKWLFVTTSNVILYHVVPQLLTNVPASPVRGGGANNNVSALPVVEKASSESGVSSSIVTVFPIRSQTVLPRGHAPLSLSLASVGGIGAILHLVRYATLTNESEALAASLILLGSLLQSISNVQDMERYNGWDVLRSMLASSMCACNRRVLEAVCRLPNTSVLCDWRVWCTAQEPFQILYFETLASESSSLKLSASELLSMFDVFETSPPGPLPGAVPVLFERVIEPLMPICDETVTKLCDFVLVVNDRPGAAAVCEAHASRPLVSPRGRPSMSPQSLRKQRQAGFSSSESLERSWQQYTSRRAAQQCCLQRLAG
jgi:hypothetical protein